MVTRPSPSMVDVTLSLKARHDRQPAELVSTSRYAKTKEEVARKSMRYVADVDPLLFGTVGRKSQTRGDLWPSFAAIIDRRM